MLDSDKGFCLFVHHRVECPVNGIPAARGKGCIPRRVDINDICLADSLVPPLYFKDDTVRGEWGFLNKSDAVNRTILKEGGFLFRFLRLYHTCMFHSLDGTFGAFDFDTFVMEKPDALTRIDEMRIGDLRIFLPQIRPEPR